MSSAIDIYKALGNDVRLSIVQELARRDEEVQGSQILSGCSRALGLAQPTLCQHFTRIVASGVLLVRKQATEIFYRLNHQALEDAGINLRKWKEV